MATSRYGLFHNASHHIQGLLPNTHPQCNEEWRGNKRRIVEKNAFNQVVNKMMGWHPKDFVFDQSLHNICEWRGYGGDG
jgi:hypothetical protein